MARYDFNAQRLFVEADLASGAHVELTREQANYLLSVLRMGEGDAVHVFNGRHGEWRAGLVPRSRRDAALAITDLVRPQEPAGDLHYLFAPLKHARLDYMVQKAVEMGASRLSPVITRRTQAARVNTERMRANAIEAAEQCGVLAIPAVDEPVKLEKLIADWPQGEAPPAGGWSSATRTPRRETPSRPFAPPARPALPVRRLRLPFSSAPKAALTRASDATCWPCRGQWSFPSARASCGRTRRPSPRSQLCRAHSGTGDSCCKNATNMGTMAKEAPASRSCHLLAASRVRNAWRTDSQAEFS